MNKTQIARALGIHRNSVDRLLKSGELTGIELSDVVAYAEKRAYRRGVEETRRAIMYLLDNKEHVLKFLDDWETMGGNGNWTTRCSNDCMVTCEKKCVQS